MLSDIDLGRLPEILHVAYVTDSYDWSNMSPYNTHSWFKQAIELAAQLAERKEQLIAAIKQHHDQKADDRCWLDDDNLYAAAGLPLVDRSVGNKAHMLQNCRRFIAQRCDGGGPWKSYIELEAENERLRRELAEANNPVVDERNSEETNER